MLKGVCSTCVDQLRTIIVIEEGSDCVSQHTCMDSPTRGGRQYVVHVGFVRAVFCAIFLDTVIIIASVTASSSDLRGYVSWNYVSWVSCALWGRGLPGGLSHLH